MRPPASDPVDAAADGADHAVFQSVYVPAYSHIYTQGGNPLRLAITLSVRNTDRNETGPG
jgi:hypothetical protein